jgi:hypothetical protein
VVVASDTCIRSVRDAVMNDDVAGTPTEAEFELFGCNGERARTMSISTKASQVGMGNNILEFMLKLCGCQVALTRWS